MADKDNLLPGDFVDWVRKDDIVSATVWNKTSKLVAIRVEIKGQVFIKHVDAKALRLIYGGAKRLERTHEQENIRFESNLTKRFVKSR